MDEEGVDPPVLKRLKARDPRDAVDLLVPGMRAFDAPSAVRERLLLVAPSALQRAVAAALPRLPPYRRVVPGCLMCCGELSQEQLAPLVASFRASAKPRLRNGRPAKPLGRPLKQAAALSPAQQRLLVVHFYCGPDGANNTLCPMHIRGSFDLTLQQLKTLVKRKEAVRNLQEDVAAPEAGGDDAADDAAALTVVAMLRQQQQQQGAV